MTVRPVRAAAAIVLGLALSPIATSVPTAAAAGQPAPVSVTMIAALTVPPRSTAFIDATQLASYTSEIGLLTRQLDQVIDRPIALGIDPSILASIRVLGTAAPPSAVAWLDRLEAATNETFPLAYADADLTLGLQAGSADVLIPESFDYAIDPSRFSTDPVDPTPLPEATETPGETPPLPTSESLVAWDYTVPAISWPAMNTVAGADLQKLSTFYGVTILSSGNVSSWSPTSASTTIGESSVLVASEALSAQFDSAVLAASGPDWEAAMATLAASAAGVTSTDDRPASVLLALGRDVPLDDFDLGLTIDTLATTANVQTATLSELLSTATGTATLNDKKHDDADVTLVAAMLDDEDDDRIYANIAESPGFITSERRLNLLATLSNGWADDPAGFAGAVASYRADSATLRNSVKIVKSSSINLWADRASLPVTVSNDLDQAITVYVTVRPLTPLIKVEDSLVAVTVEPKSQRKASIPVQSLSNGTAELAITLHSESNLQVGSTTFVRTSVQAGWETPVTVGLGVFVVLVFAAGIVRTIVRRRRARATEG